MEKGRWSSEDAPRASMPDELSHPKFSEWKFKLFRVRSMEKAPVQNETPVEKENQPELAMEKTSSQGSVMKLCFGGKSKENVESARGRVDLKLQEIDTHMNLLKNMCRLCGIAIQKAKGPSHEVQGVLEESSRCALRRMGCKLVTWPEVILKVFKVDVTTDMETVHPSLFCHRCWTATIRGGGFCSFTNTRIPDWKPHTSQCNLCFPKKSSFQRVGRKRTKPLKNAHILPKRFRRDSSESSRVWRQTTENPDGKEWLKLSVQRGQWVKSITQCQRDHLSTKLIPTEVPADMIRAVTCQVCDHLLSDPVQSPCRHLFCRLCIIRYSHALGPNCPTCNQHLNPSHLTKPAKFFLATLSSLPLLCPSEECSDWVRLDAFREHCLTHYREKESQEEQTPLEQNLDGYLPVNKGGRPRQHLLSLTRRAQKHRLRDLKNQVKTFAEKEEGGDVKSVCLTLFLLALRAGNEHKQADELEAMMQGTAKKHVTHNM